MNSVACARWQRGVVILVSLSIGQSAMAWASHYEIDPAQTTSRYETKYLGFFTASGSFERVTGTLEYDPSMPPSTRTAQVKVVIDATSLKPITLDSDAKREMLRGADFFHVEKFPTIEFNSTAFRFTEDQLTSIEGNLKLRGVSRPVSLQVTKSACVSAKPMQPARCMANAEVSVNRSEFGMSGWRATVSNLVKISVDLVAVQREPSERTEKVEAAVPEPTAPTSAPQSGVPQDPPKTR